MPPDQKREAVRRAAIAEAATFDLERALTDDLPPGADGVARQARARVIHARGPVEGCTAESSREQTVVLELVVGAWRVGEWTPGASDGGITIR